LLARSIGPSSEKNGTVLVYKPDYIRITKAPLPNVVTSSKGLLQQESNLPMVHTSDGFGLNAYKLMEKFGYDFIKSPSLGHAIEAKTYGRNDTQTMIQRQGDGLMPWISLGYMPSHASQLVKILGRHKDKWSLTRYITTEEDKNNKGNNATSNL